MRDANARRTGGTAPRHAPHGLGCRRIGMLVVAGRRRDGFRLHARHVWQRWRNAVLHRSRGRTDVDHCARWQNESQGIRRALNVGPGRCVGLCRRAGRFRFIQFWKGARERQSRGHRRRNRGRPTVLHCPVRCSAIGQRFLSRCRSCFLVLSHPPVRTGISRPPRIMLLQSKAFAQTGFLSARGPINGLFYEAGARAP